jgi:hypothetical protein
MRVYWPVSRDQLIELNSRNPLELQATEGVTVTDELADTLETQEQEELDLIAALAASDIAEGQCAVGVIELEAEIVDAELGEVRFSATVNLEDIACFLIADVESQELSWFGIQEIDSLLQSLTSKGI